MRVTSVFGRHKIYLKILLLSQSKNYNNNEGASEKKHICLHLCGKTRRKRKLVFFHPSEIPHKCSQYGGGGGMCTYMSLLITC